MGGVWRAPKRLAPVVHELGGARVALGVGDHPALLRPALRGAARRVCRVNGVGRRDVVGRRHSRAGDVRVANACDDIGPAAGRHARERVRGLAGGRCGRTLEGAWRACARRPATPQIEQAARLANANTEDTFSYTTSYSSATGKQQVFACSIRAFFRPPCSPARLPGSAWSAGLCPGALRPRLCAWFLPEVVCARTPVRNGPWTCNGDFRVAC